MEQNSSQTQDKAGEALSVSAAMALAKGALEGVCVHIIGEVSEVSNKPGYKAVYFTVKDEQASLPCMMWNNRYQASDIELKVGMLVELTGRFTLYAAKGRMNFDVFSITQTGEGLLRMQVANLARKLQAEGLMAAERKRALPEFPLAIGLVTSPRGAAIHDVLRTLRRRYPLGRILVAGVPVEGQTAPAALVEGINCVIEHGAEVVLLVRGGGSFEDLMPFNDEGLARSIADAQVPVVTGIGHEPDTSIADMVADVRASTPTAAAEAISDDIASLVGRLNGYASDLAHAQRMRISSLSMQLERCALLPLFKEPSRLFETDAQALDDLNGRLYQAIPRSLGNDRQKLILLTSNLKSVATHLTVHESEQVSGIKERLKYQGDSFMRRFTNRLRVAATGLHNLSPLGVLARGYSITSDENGSIVTSVDAVQPNDSLLVSVADGTIGCRVDRVEHTETSVESWEEA